MMKQTLAILLCGAVATGCASTGVRAVLASPQAPVANPRAAMSEYVQQLPAGSRVRVERAEGGAIRGTLMKATADALVVQKHTRVPEPPIEIPMDVVTRVTVENGNGSSTAKAVGIGIAAGVGGVLAFFAILAAAFSD